MATLTARGNESSAILCPTQQSPITGFQLPRRWTRGWSLVALTIYNLFYAFSSCCYIYNSNFLCELVVDWLVRQHYIDPRTWFASSVERRRDY